MAFVTLLYVGNLAGPLPSSARAVAVVGLAGLVFPAWAGWIDERRAVRM